MHQAKRCDRSTRAGVEPDDPEAQRKQPKVEHSLALLCGSLLPQPFALVGLPLVDIGVDIWRVDRFVDSWCRHVDRYVDTPANGRWLGSLPCNTRLGWKARMSLPINAAAFRAEFHSRRYFAFAETSRSRSWTVKCVKGSWLGNAVAVRHLRVIEPGNWPNEGQEEDGGHRVPRSVRLTQFASMIVRRSPCSMTW